VGADTLNRLQNQREQIVRTRDLIDEADDNVDSASRVLNGMARRMATNKVITALIILVLLGIIGMIIYFAIFKGNGTGSGDPTSPPSTNAPTGATPTVQSTSLFFF